MGLLLGVPTTPRRPSVTAGPVRARRTSDSATNGLVVSTPLVDAPRDGMVVEWTFGKAATDQWSCSYFSVVDNTGISPSQQVTALSGMEYAGYLGIFGEPLSEYGLFGVGGHGHIERLDALQTEIDGVTLPDGVWGVVTGDELYIRQRSTILMPTGSSAGLECGTVTLEHTFTEDGMAVAVAYDFTETGLGLQARYLGMLPAYPNRFDRWHPGALSPITITGSGLLAYGYQESTVEFRHTDAGTTPYAIGVEFPTGGPDDLVGFARSAPYRSWLNRVTVGSAVDKNYQDEHGTTIEEITGALVNTTHHVNYYARWNGA